MLQEQIERAQKVARTDEGDEADAGVRCRGRTPCSGTLCKPWIGNHGQPRRGSGCIPFLWVLCLLLSFRTLLLQHS